MLELIEPATESDGRHQRQCRDSIQRNAEDIAVIGILQSISAVPLLPNCHDALTRFTIGEASPYHHLWL